MCSVMFKRIANGRVSQMQTLLAACRELAVDYNTLGGVLYTFKAYTLFRVAHR